MFTLQESEFNKTEAGDIQDKENSAYGPVRTALKLVDTKVDIG